MPTSAGRRDEPVTAAEANRGFSRLLRGVREGASYVVTSHGRSARAADCTLLLTEDMQDGFTWRGVTVRNPFVV